MSFRMLARCLSALFFASALTAVVVKPAAAQVDVITGTVKDSAGKPIKDATVEAFSIETRVTSTRKTDDKGKFTILISDGGGVYRITVKALGMTPAIVNRALQGDDDRIIADFKLGMQAIPLADINARGSNAPNSQQAADPLRASAGDQDRSVNAGDATKLGLSLIDGIAALAALAPGVIMIPGSDTSAMAFQVNGQTIGDNSVLVDGLASAGLVPQDGLGRTRVITNTFDASRGGFTGGQVTTTTAQGGNVVRGSVSMNLRDRHFAWGAGSDQAIASGQTAQTMGAGIGGPLIRDKLSAFISFSATRSVQPLLTLSNLDSTALYRNFVAKDSATKFISLVDALGFNAKVPSISANRGSDQGSVQLRTDYRYNGNTISLSTNVNLRGSDPVRVGETQLPMVGGTQGSGGWSLQANAVNRFANAFTNSLRASYTVANTDETGLISLPTGNVRVFSKDVGGVPGTSSATLGFGGNTTNPSDTHRSTAQIDNTFSFYMGAHALRAGTQLAMIDFRNDNTSNRFGSFTYETLADFANNHPSRFTRTLQPLVRAGGSRTYGFFLNDNVTSGNWRLTLGGRIDGGFYTGAPKLNEEAQARFGVRTDKLPAGFAFSPSVGFTYNIPAPEQGGNAQNGFGQSLGSITGGFGFSRNTQDHNLPASAQAQAGFSNNETQLICDSDQVPVPNWLGYANDPATIPTVCADGSSPNPIVTGRKTLTTYEEGYGPSRAFRTSLGFRRRLAQNINVNFNNTFTRNFDISATRDLNLKLDTPFRLDNEASRPVFVNPALILTGTGQIPSSATRIDQEYGSVTQYYNRLKSENFNTQLSVSGTTRRGMQMSLSTTLSWGSDQGGSNAPTATDPNTYTWARSSNSRRVNIQGNISWPLTFTKGAVEVAVNGGVTSGSYYSPIVDRDLNGDGRRNDLAFVFDPAVAADTGVANAMGRLLGNLKGNAKECLTSQLGKIAARNSCTGPWVPSLNMNVTWRPGFFDRRLAMTFSTQNLLQGLDEIFHGADDLRGWGQNQNPQTNLLQIRGFDPATNRFKYTVNEGFGRARTETSLRPFQLTVNMRYTIGPDNNRNRILQAGGQAQNGTFGPQFIKNVQTMFPNMARMVLERKDTIALSPDQVETLTKVSNTADSTLTAIVAQLEADAKAAGGTLDPLKLAPLFVSLTSQQDNAQAVVKATLTDVQWALLPDAVRNLRSGPAALQPQGGPGRGGAGGFGGGGGFGGRGGRGGGR